MSEWLFRYTLLSAVSGCFISNLSFEKFILNVPLVNKGSREFFSMKLQIVQYHLNKHMLFH